ncbi:hypothetical protein D3C87_1689830 [compost metagenome]
MLNGKQILNSPVRLPISTWNGVFTTMSFGEVVMLVNFTCISERTYSTSSGLIAFHASL